MRQARWIRPLRVEAWWCVLSAGLLAGMTGCGGGESSSTGGSSGVTTDTGGDGGSGGATGTSNETGGTGGTTTCTPEDDANPCTEDTCEGETQTHTPKPQGTECGNAGGAVLVCDAQGVCGGCDAATDCFGDDTECRARTCVSHKCGVKFTPNNTPLAAQTDGDCKKAICDGAGHEKSAADLLDLPPDDGNPCTNEVCNNQAPGHPPMPDGTQCTDGDTCTFGDSCQSGMCVVTPLVCIGDSTCTAGDCVAPVCAGPTGLPGIPAMILPGSLDTWATGDVNGDGRLDFVATVTSAGVYSAMVSLGQGDGSFGAAVKYPIGSWARGALIADVTMDGKMDIVLSQFPASLGVLPNLGNGTFGPRVGYPSSATSPWLAAGDVNADGKMDIVAANADYDTVSVFLNQGGTFSGDTTYSAGTYPSSVAVRDLNADGKLDLAVTTSTSSGSVSVLLGAGNGTFPAKVSYPASGLLSSIASADLNGDNAPDLVFGRDGAQKGLGVLLNLGNGTFGAAAGYSGTGYSHVALADLDGDGDADAIGAGSSAVGAAVHLNMGNGTFAPPVEHSYLATLAGLTTSDVNADGKQDLVVVDSYPNSFGSILGKGDGTFREPKKIPVNDSSLSSILTVDLNADSLPDLVSVGAVLHVVMNLGGGMFGAPVITQAGFGTSAVVAGDFDGDGRVDLAVSNTNTSKVGILSNAPDFGQSTLVEHTACTSPSSLDKGDVNGDGLLDLVVTCNTGVAVLMNMGMGDFAAPMMYPAGTSPRQAKLADLNGDAKLDLLVGSYGQSLLGVRINQGDGTFGPKADYPAGGQTWTTGVADLNGDGKVDVLVGSPPELLVYIQGDNGALLPSVSYPSSGLDNLAFGDLNSDGHLDVVTCNNGGYVSVGVHYGTGAGALAPVGLLPAGNGTNGVAVADLDNDGRDDIVTANIAGDDISVLLNTCSP